MRLPTFHWCTWSDEEQANARSPTSAGLHEESPESLADKELYLWATYPAVKQAKRKGRRSKSRSKALKLWAVVIIEALQQTDAFTYEVTLRRIFKQGDRMIKVRVMQRPARSVRRGGGVRFPLAVCDPANVAGATPEPSGRQKGLQCDCTNFVSRGLSSTRAALPCHRGPCPDAAGAATAYALWACGPGRVAAA